MRAYVSGTRWCVWRWTRVNYKGVAYLIRLHLLKTPWFSVMLHWFLGPDPHPDPHDHPVAFASVVLRGGYTEHRGERGIVHKVRWLNLMPALGIHRIVSILPRTLTLVFAGAGVRRWGFHTAEGWVDWKTYGAGK